MEGHIDMSNIHAVCQQCGVGLEVEDDVTSFECPNCGARLYTNFYPINEQRIRYETRTINDRSSQSTERRHSSLAAVILAIIIFAGAGFYIGSVKPGNVQEVLADVAGTPKPAIQVRWPLSYKEAKKKTYSELSSLLKTQKFSNVKGTPISIPKVNITRIKAGQIKEIDIIAIGKTYHNNDIKKNQELSSDVEIIITYYK